MPERALLPKIFTKTREADFAKIYTAKLITIIQETHDASQRRDFKKRLSRNDVQWALGLALSLLAWITDRSEKAYHD